MCGFNVAALYVSVTFVSYETNQEVEQVCATSSHQRSGPPLQLVMAAERRETETIRGWRSLMMCTWCLSPHHHCHKSSTGCLFIIEDIPVVHS